MQNVKAEAVETVVANAALHGSDMLACIQQMAIFLVLSQEKAPLTIKEICQYISFIDSPNDVWGHMKFGAARDI